jgi:peptidoglycan/LPS O-acetylase OafA/YrhL
VTGRNLSSLAGPLIFAAIVLVFAEERGVLSSGLLTRPFQALGRWSYSIYLVHVLLYQGAVLVAVLMDRMFVPGLVVRHGFDEMIFVGGSLLSLLAVALLCAVSIAVSPLTWRFVEAPGQRLAGRIAARIGR